MYNKTKMENPSKKCSKTSIAQNVTAQIYNARGRPVKSKIIQFTPQPKSVISQLLQNTINKAVHCKYNNDEQVSKEILEEHSGEKLCLLCTYRCCNKKEDYKRHLNSNKEYSCEYPDCTYTTKLSSNLIKHKRKHTSEKPFLCDQCTFRTNFINSLKVHKRTHTAERPYACKLCSYKCNSSSNLKKHCHHRHAKNSLTL